MAVNKKGFRKVNYKGRQYLWTVRDVQEEIPEQGFVAAASERYVHIIASNKAFIVRYRMPRAGDEFTYLYSEGKEFPRSPGATRVEFPRWRHDSKRYPTADFVRRVIDWCMTPAGQDPGS